MKATIITRIANLVENFMPLTLTELPIPQPRDHQLLLAVSACGVRHTERDEIEGRTPPSSLPIVPGHQVIGRAVAIAAKVADFLRRRTGWRGFIQRAVSVNFVNAIRKTCARNLWRRVATSTAVTLIS